MMYIMVTEIESLKQVYDVQVTQNIYWYVAAVKGWTK